MANRPISFTQQDLTILSQYPAKPIRQIAQELGLKVDATRVRLKRLGWYRPTTARYWTIAEVQQVKQFCQERYPMSRKDWAELRKRFNLSIWQAKYVVEQYVRGIKR